MVKKMMGVALGLALVAGLAGQARSRGGHAVADAGGGEVTIQVSPATIALRSSGHDLTVHADLPFGVVDSGSLTLDGLAATGSFADDRGDLVVKFDLDAVKQRVAPPSARLTLYGSEIDGTPFQGSDTVRVEAGR